MLLRCQARTHKKNYVFSDDSDAIHSVGHESVEDEETDTSQLLRDTHHTIFSQYGQHDLKLKVR